MLCEINLVYFRINLTEKSLILNEIVIFVLYCFDNPTTRRDVEMEKTVYLPSFTIKLEALLLKWEGVITAVVALCAVVAIILGIIWLFLRKDNLLFVMLGFSSCYLIGRKFWRFRPQGLSLEN
jgi:ABC-type branched-subunit amino acid transport system permease subunit